LTREEKKAQTRQQLLDAAHRVFSTKGFFSASLDDVATEAGFSKGAVYSNFDSKEDLFLALVEFRADQQAKSLARDVDVDQSVGVQARSAGDQFVREHWADNLDASDLEFRVCVARNPELRDRLIPRVRELRATVAHLIEQGARARGTELSLPAETIATMVTALTNGLALERLQNPEAVPDDLYGQMLAILFEAVEVRDPR
jgi:AcrR family transcriptional regulator